MITLSNGVKKKKLIVAPDKKGVKAALKKWQDKSQFGLSYAPKKIDAEGMPNGYEKAMRFNLKIV